MVESAAKKKIAVDLVELLDGESNLDWRFCYTKVLLKSVLQLMGCKARVAHKVMAMPMHCGCGHHRAIKYT